jgi:broad-specificity NMP kinase
MGVRNFLVEGVSGTGKTSVCRELRRRGHQAVNGDTELAYQGDPDTGVPTGGRTHDHHIWDVRLVRSLVADRQEPLTFLCGGSRNFPQFIDLFDAVFVLQVDRKTLQRRLDQRPDDDWGARESERRHILRLHESGEDVPPGIAVDATAPLEEVVDQILRHTEAIGGG